MCFKKKTQETSFIVTSICRRTCNISHITSGKFKCGKLKSALEWDNHIQIFHLGSYIVVYTVGNHFYGAVKQIFRPYFRRYTSPNEKCEYSYPLILSH